MDGYQIRWIQEGSTWKTILDRIQLTIDHFDFVKSWGVELTHERWDAPELNMQWYAPGDIGRAIQILITGSPGVYELHISVSAWKDFDLLRRERKWKAEYFSKISVPSDPSQLDVDHLAKTLKDAHTYVSNWTESDLTNRDDLPQRPPNLTSSMVRGRYIP